MLKFIIRKKFKLLIKPVCDQINIISVTKMK